MPLHRKILLEHQLEKDVCCNKWMSGIYGATEKHRCFIFYCFKTGMKGIRALKLYCAPNRREEGNKRCVCPSVCLSGRPSVTYIANNTRTQRPSVPKFGMKVPHLRCDSHTSFEVKRSKVRVRGGQTVSVEPGGHIAR